MSVPSGTRNLFIRCSDDRQFGGILSLLEELNRSPGSHSLAWEGTAVDLSRRRALRRVVISGHGSPERAGFELDSARALRPGDLRLPGNCSLYLMGCCQGRQRQRLSWAMGTGVEANRVWGCTGETESALSTCMLLHLLEDGVESIDSWFPVWIRCNDAARPYFPVIREVYTRSGADPIAALAELRAEGELDAIFREYGEFLGVIARRPAYLTGLV